MDYSILPRLDKRKAGTVKPFRLSGYPIFNAKKSPAKRRDLQHQ